MIDIRRIILPTQYGMNTVNCFLIKGDEPTLIDCGEDSDESWNALTSGLKENNIAITDIKKLVITHAHVDHIGMARRVARAASCEVWVSDKVKDWALNVHEMWDFRTQIMKNSVSMFLNQEMSSGVISMFGDMSSKIMDQWHAVDPGYIKVFDHSAGYLSMGGYDWKILYAPGHSNTQNCFYHEETQQMISADMLLSITPTPVLEPDAIDPSKREKSVITMLESYKVFRSIEMSEVYPGHYDIFNDPISKIDQQVTRIHQRKEECFELIKSGTSDLLGLFQELYKGRWHMPAFNMTIAYLDLLESEDRIELVREGNNPYQVLIK